MERIKVIKKPTESEVITVNKKEIEEMKKKYPSISMGNHDKEYLKKFKDDEIVGVVAGDLDNIEKENADLWFINIDYFRFHYKQIME